MENLDLFNGVDKRVALTSSVEPDEITEELSKSFDYAFAGVSSFFAPEMPEIPSSFGIGLIVGPSGSGKSTLLAKFGNEEQISWNPSKAICSHFENAIDAQDRLSAVGLNSVPSWMRPYHVLSTGEKFRADMARRIKNNAVIDEFTSVVDRNVAKSCSYALRRYCDKTQVKNIVLASCHYDIIEWLQPDWVFDTRDGSFAVRGLQRRPSINLEIVPCSHKEWAAFSQHHYLTEKINKSSRCWIALWDGVPVGFSSSLAFPNGSFKNAWRGHRTVVLPDYQGLGIGVRISDAVASMFVEDGCRYFSKTSHPRMGEYRNASPFWKPTSKNMKARKDYKTDRKNKYDATNKEAHAIRVCYSHEYVKTLDL